MRIIDGDVVGVGERGWGVCWYFFFNDTATTEIYTLSLHDALPILNIYHLPLELNIYHLPLELDIYHLPLELDIYHLPQIGRAHV